MTNAKKTMSNDDDKIIRHIECTLAEELKSRHESDFIIFKFSIDKNKKSVQRDQDSLNHDDSLNYNSSMNHINNIRVVATLRTKVDCDTIDNKVSKITNDHEMIVSAANHFDIKTFESKVDDFDIKRALSFRSEDLETLSQFETYQDCSNSSRVDT